jgi:hypothetical protein
MLMPTFHLVYRSKAYLSLLNVRFRGGISAERKAGSVVSSLWYLLVQVLSLNVMRIFVGCSWSGIAAATCSQAAGKSMKICRSG